MNEKENKNKDEKEKEKENKSEVNITETARYKGSMSTMTVKDMLEQAVHIMVDSQKGQVDKAGQPYFLHPMRVALNCETSLQKTVAFLHDVIEDTTISSVDLKRYGFTDEVVEAVLSLTRKPEENYEAFIQRCALNPIGRYVKIRDLEDNLDVKRLDKLDNDAANRINKYLKALRFLKSLN